MSELHTVGPDYNMMIGLGVIGAITLAVFFFLAWMMRLHLGIQREGSLMLSAVVTLLGVGASVYAATHGRAANPTDELLRVFGAGFFVVTGVPLGLKIYRAWIGVDLTPEEAAPGAVGIRAWLSPLKLIVAVAVAACAYFAYHVPLVEGVLIWMGLLLVYPIGNSLGRGASPTVERADLGPERERVLSMLEAGRITGEECAELLSALAATEPPAAGPERKFSSSDRRALVGAVIVLIAFFLPWYRVNPAAEMQRLMGTLSGALGQPATSVGLPNMQMSITKTPGVVPPQDETGTAFGMIVVSGGDLQHGLGWVVLFCGLGTALLPFFGGGLDEAARRMLSQLALGAGTIILIYLIVGGFRFVAPGLVLAAVGYVFEITSLVWPKARGAWSPESKESAAERGVA